MRLVEGGSPPASDASGRLGADGWVGRGIAGWLSLLMVLSSVAAVGPGVVAADHATTLDGLAGSGTPGEPSVGTDVHELRAMELAVALDVHSVLGTGVDESAMAASASADAGVAAADDDGTLKAVDVGTASITASDGELASVGDMYSVSGTVTDGVLGKPVAGATVTFDNGTDETTVTTNASGKYNATLPQGTYDVTVAGTVGGRSLVGVAARDLGLVANTTNVNATAWDDLDGSGTAGDPFVVGTVFELQSVAANLSADYALETDVDASATAEWNDGKGFDPIGETCGGKCDPGEAVEPFAGTFDGAGHVISNLTINRTANPRDDSNSQWVGLFGYSSGTVQRVGLADAYVRGVEVVGGLVGFSEGTVEESYVTGSVRGTSRGVGGLVGQTDNATVRDSYSTADVTSSDIAGGLVGTAGDGGTVTRSFAAGAISGSGTGGLIGNNGIHATDLYWDEETTGDTVGTRNNNLGSNTTVLGLPTANMTGAAAETNMTALDWATTWVTTDGYPTLRWDAEPASLDVSIDATNSPVDAPGTLEVNVSVTNAGELTGTQTVKLADPDGTTVDGVSVTLTGGASNDSIVLTWAASTAAAGTGSVTVSSANDSETAAVTITAATGSGGSSGGDRRDDGDRADEVRVEPLDANDDGTAGGRRIVVTGATGNRPLSMDVTSNASGTGAVAVDRIDLTPRRGGDYELTVQTRDASTASLTSEDGGTGAPDRSLDALAAGERQFVVETGRRPLGFLQVDHAFPDTDVGDVTMVFRVRKAELEALGVEPGAVQLFRAEPDGPRALPTRLLGETSAYYRFAASSPGLSVFTVGAATATFTVETATAGPTVRAGEPIAVSVTVRNIGSADGAFLGRLTASGDHLDETAVTIPAGATRTVVFEGELRRIGPAPLRLNDRALETIEVVPATTHTSESPTGGGESSASAAPPERSELGGEVGLLAGLAAAGLLAGGLVVRRRRAG